MEKPLVGILDRNLYPQWIKEHFSDSIELVRDFVNYGTKLVPRCFVSSDRKLDDVVIVISMLKHSIALLDSIEILASAAAPSQGNIILRSLWEMNLYIKWILKEDTDSRAMMYYIFEQRLRLYWTKAAKKGTNESVVHLQFMQDGPSDMQNSFKDPELIDYEIERIESLLNSKECKKINNKFDAIKKAQRDRNWFSVSGVKSIRDMAKSVDMEAEYHVHYSGYCKVTHGQVFFNQVGFRNKEVIYEPIRNMKGLDILLLSSITYMMRIYTLIIRRYRPDEEIIFNKKYINEWRSRFQAIPKLKHENGNIIVEIDDK
jgi:hypothetical protein